MTQDEVDKYCESVPYNPNGRGGKRKPRYGVGINDLPHVTKIKDEFGKTRTHSGYVQWWSLLARCYCERELSKCPTYRDVLVCDDWLKASNFVAWQKTQYREEGWQLDKDLISIGNRVYSPDTCLYVPSWLNSFTLNRSSDRGEFLIGCCWNKQSKKYHANCNHPLHNSQGYLGLFDTELEAHLAWRERKLNIALELKPQMDIIDIRVYPNVVTIITNAR